MRCSLRLELGESSGSGGDGLNVSTICGALRRPKVSGFESHNKRLYTRIGCFDLLTDFRGNVQKLKLYNAL